MPTKEEYLAQGKSEQQIQDATVAKNTADMSAKLGQNLQATSYNVVPNTPVSTPISTPAPVNPSPVVTEQPKNEPIAPVSNTQPVATAPVNVEPVKTEIPVSTPAPVVEKTTTTTPQGETVVKKETPQAVTPDYNVGKGREQDILTNLNNDLKSNIGVQKALQNGDYNTFKQNYGYDTADQTKKQMLDAFFQANQPKNSESFLQILASGQKIQNSQYKSSPEAADAQHRYDVLSPYIGANSTTLYDAMVSGKLYPGSDAYKDLLSVIGGVETPAMTEAKVKYERKQQVDKINNNLSNLSGNKPETQTGLQKISDNLVQTKGMDYATEFQKDVVNNPAITDKVTELNGVTEQIKNLEYTKSQSLKEIMKKNPGISIGSAILEANRENEGINDELNQLYNKQSSLKANVDYATNLAEKMFGYKIEQNKEKVAQEQALAQEQRQFTRQKELAQYNAQLGLETNQAEFDQKVKQQAQLASDPYTAISTVMDEYKKLGVPFTQSIATKVTDANAFIANGGTIGGYVDKMIGDIQKKPEYKALTAPTTSIEKPFTVSKDSYVYDPATGTFKSPTAGTGVTGADVYQQMTASTNPIGVYATGDMDGSRHASIYKTAQEMGLDAFINKYEGTKITSEMVNTAAQEYGVDPLMIAATMALDSSMGTKGKGARNNNPGNIGQFDSLDAQGITVKGYATLQDGVNAVANNLLKRQNALGVSSIAGEKKEREYTDSDIALLSSVTKLDKQGKETLKDNGYTEKEWANFQAGLLPPTSRQKADAKNIVDKVDGIFAGDWSDAVGPIKSMIWTGAGSDRKVTELKVNALKDLLAMANLDKIKGAMSDKDIEFLRNTATYLSTDLSEDEFEKTLNEIKNKYAGIVQGTPTTGTQTNTGAGVVNYNGFNLPK